MISPQVLHFTHKPLGISCFFVLVSEIFGFSFSSNTAMTNLLRDGKGYGISCPPANHKTLAQQSSIAPVGKISPVRTRDGLGLLVSAATRLARQREPQFPWLQPTVRLWHNYRGLPRL